MTKLLLAALVSAGLIGVAGGQASAPPADQTELLKNFHFWSHADLDRLGNALSPQMDAHKFKSDTLAPAGNHRYLIVHREGSGQSEYHEKEADIMFIQTGTGTLLYGGTIVGGKSTGPGEIRGDGISGAQEHKVGPGDVVAIPARLPHQMKVDDGVKMFNYFVVKITE